MIYGIVMVCLMAFLATASATQGDVSAFHSYMETWGRTYKLESPEYHVRFANFIASVKKIEELNANPEDTAIYGLTKFSDLSTAEFKKFYLNGASMSDKEAAKALPKSALNIRRQVDWGANTTVDWSTTGAQTPVKDQGQCGSCWAFSATEEIESMTYMAGNDLPTLAPQQIVSCDTAGNDQGCNGGLTEGAYAYVIDAGGLESESSYPYIAQDTACTFDESKITASITGFSYAVPKCGFAPSCKNACQDMEAAIQVAPISVCVFAEPWQHYQGGILSAKNCAGRTDHCVQLSGYSTDDQGNDYWIVRNSWATEWGEKGFIWLEKGAGLDTCNVCSDATYAIVN
jgi:C1A family cysteine protease